MKSRFWNEPPPEEEIPNLYPLPLAKGEANASCR